MARGGIIFSGVWFIIYAAISNSWTILRKFPLLIVPAILLFLLVNIFAGAPHGNIPIRRLKVERHGAVCLSVFLLALLVSAVFQVWLGLRLWHEEKADFIFSVLWCVLSLSVIFWNGIISVYMTSVQLGIRIRVIGIICGWIPVVNIIALCKIVSVCRREVKFETGKYLLNEARREKEICRTNIRFF